MTSSIRYRILYNGERLPGWAEERVRAGVRDRFGLSNDRLALLFSGRWFTLKRNVDLATARRLQAVLEALGARAVIEPEPAPPTLAAQSTPSDAPLRASSPQAQSEAAAGQAPSTVAPAPTAPDSERPAQGMPLARPARAMPHVPPVAASVQPSPRHPVGQPYNGFDSRSGARAATDPAAASAEQTRDRDAHHHAHAGDARAGDAIADARANRPALDTSQACARDDEIPFDDGDGADGTHWAGAVDQGTDWLALLQSARAEGPTPRAEAAPAPEAVAALAPEELFDASYGPDAPHSAAWQPWGVASTSTADLPGGGRPTGDRGTGEREAPVDEERLLAAITAGKRLPPDSASAAGGGTGGTGEQGNGAGANPWHVDRDGDVGRAIARDVAAQGRFILRRGRRRLQQAIRWLGQRVSPRTRRALAITAPLTLAIAWLGTGGQLVQPAHDIRYLPERPTVECGEATTMAKACRATYALQIGNTGRKDQRGVEVVLNETLLERSIAEAPAAQARDAVGEDILARKRTRIIAEARRLQAQYLARYPEVEFPPPPHHFRVEAAGRLPPLPPGREEVVTVNLDAGERRRLLLHLHFDTADEILAWEEILKRVSAAEGEAQPGPPRHNLIATLVYALQ